MAPSEALPETPTLNETTLLPNAEEGFALEPVPVTRMSKDITITNSNVVRNLVSSIVCVHQAFNSDLTVLLILIR